MTYTIGDRTICLDRGVLNEEEVNLIFAHSKLFKYCINDASYNYFQKLKKVIYLYGDILTIYSTLLRKVPNYDDITLMTNRTCLQLGKLEDDFNKLFGSENTPEIYSRRNWDESKYERGVRPMALLCVKSTEELFEAIIKTLNCIELFFDTYDNLKKLLIPYLLNQTQELKRSVSKAVYLFSLVTIVDDIKYIKNMSPVVFKQLRKIEKITTGIERESVIIESFFDTFNPSMEQYTNILLGKAILKRDISLSECQILKRRHICYQASEYVVSIPLTEDNYKYSSISKMATMKYVAYLCFAFFLAITMLLYRLIRMIIS